MSTQVIIGDDLTGAMDTGVLFAKRWPRVSVVFDKCFVEEMTKHNDALIIDSESRNVAPGKAYSIVQGYVECLEKAGSELIYKKIDSTMRGNIGKELEAILDDSGFDMIALVPALPLNGRTTVNGYHYLNGRLLTESDLASDPFSPVKSSYIPDILKGQTALKTAVVELHVIRGGCGHLAAVLSELNKTGCRIAVMDAESEEDLGIISSTLSNSGLKILPCGSAGLFSRMYIDELRESAPVNSDTNKDKPLVVLSGSPAKMSKLQIESARNHGEIVIKLDGAKIITGADVGLVELNRVKNLTMSFLKAGKNVVIDGAGAGKKDLNEAYSGKPEMLLETSRRIQEAIAGIAKEIADNVEISGMLIFGGDTALSICRKLGAKALRILGEVEPLVPYGTFSGGRLDDVFVATKAGGFGSEDIIPNAIKFFRT